LNRLGGRPPKQPATLIKSPYLACGESYAALTVAADDKEVLTVEFKVNLLSPAAGEVYAARAQVKKAGPTLRVCTADAFAISDGREKVVATMLATIMAVPITPAK
jgi:acyl-coenzyme A thioesterase PaaI-like protein